MNKEDLQQEFNKLYKAYKELESSKLVLVEKSVSKLLEVIAKNEGIYNLIAESVLGFNYDKELSAVLQSEQFVLSSNNEKTIPLVFCILNDIDNGKISAIPFISSSFMDASEAGYKKFCKCIVEPFILAIKEEIGASDAPEEKIENASNIEEKEKLKKLFNSELVGRINYVIGEIDNKLNCMKRCDVALLREAGAITYSMALCLFEKEYIGVFGLLVGLKHVLAKLKKFKNEIKELDLLLKVLFNED